MSDFKIDAQKAVDNSITIARGSSATKWRLLVSSGNFFLQNNYNSTNGWTDTIKIEENNNPDNTIITICGRLFINNGITLSNNGWSTYGTSSPEGNITGSEGRLYFKII